MNPELGRRMWEILHAYFTQYPKVPDPLQMKQARKFLMGFAVMVDSMPGACDCSKEWSRMVYNAKPPYEDGQAMRAWCIAAHDWVNQKLGVPLYAAQSAESDLFRLLTHNLKPSPVDFSPPCCQKVTGKAPAEPLPQV